LTGDLNMGKEFKKKKNLSKIKKDMKEFKKKKKKLVRKY
jgi:hypothetical protein